MVGLNVGKTKKLFVSTLGEVAKIALTLSSNVVTVEYKNRGATVKGLSWRAVFRTTPAVTVKAPGSAFTKKG